MGSATTVIVLTLTAINALDSPYRAGPGQIQPTAMERTIKLIDDARTAVGQQTPLPCSEQGLPVAS